jgi:hypothetical protein
MRYKCYPMNPDKRHTFSKPILFKAIDEGGPLLSISSIKLGLLKENDK